jgi:hypothetical protein
MGITRRGFSLGIEITLFGTMHRPGNKGEAQKALPIGTGGHERHAHPSTPPIEVNGKNKTSTSLG